MMDTLGTQFHVSWLVWINLAVLAFVLVLALVALLALRRRPMDEISRFLWALLIVFVPILGPVVFFIVRPESLDAERRRTT